MKILYYDCFSGISGDMNLGALIDIGVDKEYLVKELLKLNIEDEYELIISNRERKSISGTKVDVVLRNNSNINEDKEVHGDCGNHIHEHQNHNEHIHHENEKQHVHSHESHNHSHEEQHEHHYRNLSDIENIINSSSLNDNIKNISKGIFGKVAKAEAKIHNKTIEKVHFHEVGAVDSIIDIVGAAICIDYLGIDKVMCSNVEVGSGFVKCAHGLLPVPAPATTEILKGIPIKANISFEATTPTGAAILAYSVDEFTNNKNFKVDRIGYGIGGKDVGEIPNVLRVFIGEYIDKDMESYKGEIAAEEYVSQNCLKDEVQVLECNIDDMNPELYEYIMELLFKEGALDVYLTPIIMKKGRPGIKLNVLCNLEKEERIKKIILTETTTLGFRRYKAERDILKREFTKVNTRYGDITIKSSYYDDKKVKCKPEYDECKKAALEHKVSINEIYKEVFKNM
jgi:uncharacterized protein (TIGR00299 family) protein